MTDAESSFANRTVLIADDAFFIRHIVKKAIAGLDFKNILEAETGVEILDLYRTHRPELVLMDIVMREMNGLETLEHLFREDPDARIIMVSAVDVPEILNECIGLGIADFVVKPFRADDLRQAIWNCFHARGS